MAFGVLETLAVSVLLGNIINNRFIKPVHPAERNVVRHRSPPVPIVMVHESRSKAENNASNIHRITDQYPAL